MFCFMFCLSFISINFSLFFTDSCFKISAFTSLLMFLIANKINKNRYHIDVYLTVCCIMFITSFTSCILC